MAQRYPGYDYEQVKIVASRIPDTIVAFGQTRHNIICEREIKMVVGPRWWPDSTAD
jgi:hypothetical protein